MMRMQGRDEAQLSRSYLLADGAEARRADGLNPYLHHPARPLVGLLHPPRVVGVERHRLFLVNVLPGVDGGNEMQRVKVLRRRDQDRVNGLVVQQATKILMGLNGGNEGFHFVEPAGVHIRHRHRLHVGTVNRGVQDLPPPAAAANQADSNAVVRPQHPLRRKEPRSRQHRRASQSLLDKCPSS